MAMSLSSLKMLLLVVLVVQNSSFALVGRYTRSSVPTEDLYVVYHVIFCTECLKFVVSCVLESYHHNNKNKNGASRTNAGALWESVQIHIVQNPIDALKISVPALLYLVQTSLLFVALANMTASLYQVAFQGKLLVTALVSVMMLQRRYTMKQWLCLVSLGLGVAIVVLGEKLQGEKLIPSPTAQQNQKQEQRVDNTDASLTENPSNLILGLACVATACICSALASVYTEKLLKSKPVATTTAGPLSHKSTASLWMRNIQMASFSILICLVQWGTDKSKDATKPFLFGFTPFVYSLIIIQVVGGLLVAAVMKYADNVLKGLAMGVSVVLSTACSVVLFDETPLPNTFCTGAVIVLASVYLFSNDVPMAILKIASSMSSLFKAPTPTKALSEFSTTEMQPLTVY